MIDALPEKVFPPLREDLVIVHNQGHQGGITLFDPVQNRYFQLNGAATAILPHWRTGTASEMGRAILNRTGKAVALSEIEVLHRFLRGNHLLRLSTREIAARQDHAHKARGGIGKILMHNYISFRIPLLRPDPMLNRLLPLFRRLISPPFLILMVLMGVIGWFLAARQWEAFLTSFADLYSWQGLVGFGIALTLLKSLHELGHGLMARHFGCRVSAMGVAFIVLWPVLYTDVSDAWRLPQRSQRLRINAAGLLTELAVASLAMMVWHLLPEGSARSIAFIIATTSWILSVGVNLNPFMRFDGYYLLSDFLQVPNLQQRAFELGRWRLREMLFGFGLPPPERFSPAMQRLLILHAWGTWLYRFFLFLGIALLVYHFFIKVVGIFLFAVEIAIFIFLPVWRELRQWRRGLSGQTSGFALIRTLVLLGAASFSFFFPWNPRIEALAVLEARHHGILFADTPARLKRIHVQRGQHVVQGEVLFLLESPGLESRAIQAQHQRSIAQFHLDRMTASAEALSQLHVHLQTRQRADAILAGLQRETQHLTITAPMSGLIVELKEGLHPGLWVDSTTALAHVVDPSQAEGHIYLPENDFSRLDGQARCRFYPDDLSHAAIDARLTRFSPTATRKIPQMMTSQSGGPIAARRTQHGEILAETPYYEGSFIPSVEMSAPVQKVMGHIVLEGTPVSLAARLFKRVSSLLIRESGF